jgi:hypothetical protein
MSFQTGRTYNKPGNLIPLTLTTVPKTDGITDPQKKAASATLRTHAIEM